MFTTRLSRAAPRATSALSSTTTQAVTAAGSSGQAARCLATRPTHARRHSSSKASPPSDSTGTASGKPAPQQAKGKEDVENVNGSGSGRRKPGLRRAGGFSGEARREKGMVGKERAVVGKENGVDRFAGLPSVPSLQGLERMEVQKDLSISSFFSLHRPISLTNPIPPVVDAQTFSAIFSARNNQDPWHNGNSAERRPEDIIITLNNTIEMLEGHQSQSENDGVRWEVVNESPSNAASEGAVKHLDGAPRMKSLDEVVANFRPFRAPPPPEPFDEKYMRTSAGSGTLQQQQKKKASGVKARKPKQKVYITEIRVTESTHSDGRKTYAASSTPIRRLQEDPAATITTSTSSGAVQDMALPSGTRQTFLQRIRRKQQQGIRVQMTAVSRPVYLRRNVGMGWRRREEWVLISVKRQRKLKMKKHKHKKLMKRTRNLRRRLGRT